MARPVFDLDTHAWYDPHTDSIMIRVRTNGLNARGQTVKQGCIVRITEEQFYSVGEGMEYPHISPKEVVPDVPCTSSDRWVSLLNK